jgi:hypothetical protein
MKLDYCAMHSGAVVGDQDLRCRVIRHDDGRAATPAEVWAEMQRLTAEATKSERRAITFGDIVAQQTMAMRAAVVAAELEGAEAGMRWIANTLCGPGHLPDVQAAKAEGGAQAMFDREMAEHEAFRAAHPAP